MNEFRYDTQLLIEGVNLDEDAINDYFTEHFKGDCLLVVGDEELIKIHFHTNRGRCWNTVQHSARFLISSWRIWIGRRAACRGNAQCLRPKSMKGGLYYAASV